MKKWKKQWKQFCQFSIAYISEKKTHNDLKFIRNVPKSQLHTTQLYPLYNHWKLAYNGTRPQTFHSNCLRNIKRIFWQHIISNKQLFITTGQDAMNNILARRCWIGNVLRKKDESRSKTTLRETLGKWKHGWPTETWRKRRTVETERGLSKK